MRDVPDTLRWFCGRQLYSPTEVPRCHYLSEFVGEGELLFRHPSGRRKGFASYPPSPRPGTPEIPLLGVGAGENLLRASQSKAVQVPTVANLCSINVIINLAIRERKTG